MAMACTSTTFNDATLEDLVKCAICLDYYNDPRLLPCSHTFCFRCIQDLCKTGNSQCPMRDNTIIYRHMINQLPINRIAKDFVDCINKKPKLKSSSLQTNCNHCKNIISEFICKTCSKNYCLTCLKLQHDINQLKTHSISSIINENSNIFCPEHIEEKQKYWCESCQQTVCSDCLLFKHKQHSFITLHDIAQKTKTQLISFIPQFTSMKEDLEKLNKKTTEAYQTHYQTHIRTKEHIEQTINNLQTLLEERKKYLIKTITEKDVSQQQIIRQQKNNIEEYLKIVLVRELLTKQILNIEDPFQLVRIQNDLFNHNQSIEQQYKQLMQGYIFNLHNFTIENNFTKIQQQLEELGNISTVTYLTNSNHIHPLLNLSDLSGDEKHQEFQGIYAYGYRFHLTTILKLNAIRIKIALFDNDLTIYILDHNDLLIQQEFIKINNEDYTTLKWITIPITCQIQHNYCIFIWTQSNDISQPLIAYRDSTHNLRQINEYVSVRSKRAQINKSINIDINTKFNVLYDALLTNDEQNQTTVPAIEMILDI